MKGTSYSTRMVIFITLEEKSSWNFTNISLVITYDYPTIEAFIATIIMNK